MNPDLPASAASETSTHRDHAIERLEFLTDGVFAIALTLLALDLRLPDEALHSSGSELLASLINTWPKLLSYVTSFTVVAMFWVVNHRIFHYIVRFDGRLRWLTLLQLGLVALVPFPSSVLGDHLNDPVAQEFYFGTLALTLLVSGAIFWHASWNRRLISTDMSDVSIRYYRVFSAISLVAFLALLIAIPIGMSNMLNPLILGYLIAFIIIAFGLLDRAEPTSDTEGLSERETLSL